MRIQAVCLTVVGWGLLAFVPALHAQQWAEKMFDKLEVNFGSVAQGSDVHAYITVTNKYEEPMEFTDVRTKCACISASIGKRTLNRLESTVLDVKLNTIGFRDRKDSMVYVEIGGRFPAHVEIPTHAFIRTDVVMTPGSVDFGPLAKGAAVERRVQIAYAGRNDWAITSIQNGSQNLDAKLVETGRGGGRVNYDLVVKTKPTAPLGDLRTQLTLVTNDQATPRLPVMVEGRIEPEYTVAPEVLQFGVLQPGEKKTMNIVVRSNNRKAFGIEKLQSEKTADVFEVRLPADKRTVHVMPLTFTAPSEAGTINEEFTIKVAGVEDPIHFRVYGKVLTTTGAARLIGR